MRLTAEWVTGDPLGTRGDARGGAGGLDEKGMKTMTARGLRIVADHGDAIRDTALLGTALHATALHATALHATALHATALHATALQATALHATALHATARHGAALHGTALPGTTQWTIEPIDLVAAGAADAASGDGRPDIRRAPTGPPAAGTAPDDWSTRAVCATQDPDLLFVTGAAQRDAARLCQGCPVKLECLADALDNRVEFGVWGGLTERQRRAVLKRNPAVTSWRTMLEQARSEATRQVAG